MMTAGSRYVVVGVGLKKLIYRLVDVLWEHQTAVAYVLTLGISLLVAGMATGNTLLLAAGAAVILVSGAVMFLLATWWMILG